MTYPQNSFWLQQRARGSILFEVARLWLAEHIMKINIHPMPHFGASHVKYVPSRPRTFEPLTASSPNAAFEAQRDFETEGDV